MLTAAAALAALVAASIVLRLLRTPVSAFEAAFARLARRRTLSIVLIAAVALGGRLLILPLSPMPLPLIQDEFSNLLAADTFAHGRLTNPTHPMWVHLESFHINWRPTYQSMYPPGQALMMALGQVVFGHPWFGIWLSIGLMCAACCWMLQGWFPPRWALLGALLITIRFAFLGEWINSYYRAPLAAAAGAIAMGVLPRIERKPRAFLGVALAISLIILANTRLFEGLILGIPVVCAAASLLRRSGVLMRVAIPAGATLAAGALAMGYYNFRVTGHPLLLPYAVNRSQYGLAKNFVLQHPDENKSYNHREMEREYRRQLQNFNTVKSRGFLRNFLDKVITIERTYLGTFQTMAIVWAPAAWLVRRRLRSPRILLGAFLFCLTGLLSETWLNPHYPAPMMSLIFALVILGLRQLNIFPRKLARPDSRGQQSASIRPPRADFLRRWFPPYWLARAIPVCVFLAFLNGLIGDVRKGQPAGGIERASILNRPELAAGKHLLIVRYAPGHNTHHEWVYNGADIDSAKVVWAREMQDPSRRQELFDYFKDRQVWLVEPDARPPRISPYQPPHP